MAGETVLLRGIEAQDQNLLEEMTYEAAVAGLRSPGGFQDIMGEGQFAYCFENWGQRGDDGLVAFADEDEELGAAWYRLCPDRYHALGENRSYTPEIIMALKREARGEGVGRLLLGGLMDHAREQGIARLRLTVVKNNVPAVRLYKGLGFKVTGETPTVVGTEAAWSFRMAAWLTDRSSTPEQEWYTETDYERSKTPIGTVSV